MYFEGVSQCTWEQQAMTYAQSQLCSATWCQSRGCQLRDVVLSSALAVDNHLLYQGQFCEGSTVSIAVKGS